MKVLKVFISCNWLSSYIYLMLTVNMDDSCLHRLERETLKYMEIENIFYRLKHSESVQPIYALFKEIFEKEHQFTIQELMNMARNRNYSLKEFNVAEQYKLNSHIFKQNLALIINIMIDDIWVEYNKRVSAEQFAREEPRHQLFQIEEESQVENCKTEMDQIDHGNSGLDLTSQIDQVVIGADLQSSTEVARDERPHSSMSYFDISKTQRPPLALQHQQLLNPSPRQHQETCLSYRSNTQFKTATTPRTYQGGTILPSSLGAMKYLQRLNLSNKKKKHSNDHISLNVSSKKERKQNNSAEGARHKPSEGEYVSPRPSKKAHNVNLKGLIQRMTMTMSLAAKK